MTEFIVCPRCSGAIFEERMNEILLICPHCGWMNSASMNQADDKIQRSIALSLMAICVLFVSSFIMVVNWDKYALEIIPLKIKQYAGTAEKADLNQIASICQERGKPACIESAYAEVVSKWPEDVEAISYYAKILAFNGKQEASIEAYEKYFSHNINNPDIAYDYAKVLAESGQVKQAIKFYEDALRGKPGILQVTVLRNYVEFLIENGRLKNAERLILKTRRLGTNTRSFMEKELSEIKKLLRNA